MGWKILKVYIEFALANVIDSKSIFSRSSEIKGAEDPDGVIEDMFAELRAILYLHFKGFQNIKYNRRNGLDFIAEFEGEIYFIEVAHLRGPSFKTQELAPTDTKTPLLGSKLGPTKLVSRLKSIYSKKSDQIKRNKVFADNDIHIDVSNGEAGTAYPIGTVSRPVNNFTDAKIIADANFLASFHIIGDLNISINEDIEELTFLDNDEHDNEIILNGSNTTRSVFRRVKISGTLNGFITADRCFIGNLINFKGIMRDTLLEGNITLTGDEAVHLIDCRSAVLGVTTPIIDMGGSGRGLGVRNYSGGIKLINKTGSESVSLDFNSGQVIIDSTCINGDIVIRGNCTVTDNSTGNCNVINQSIHSLLKRTLGLTQENFRIKSPVYDDNNSLISATISIYGSANDCTNDNNPITSYSMVATYDGDNNMSSYKVTKS